MHLSCCERYDSELSLRQLLENDISGLRGILGELSLCRSDLEAQVESLKDDLLCLKKSHQEVRKIVTKDAESDKAQLTVYKLCVGTECRRRLLTLDHSLLTHCLLRPMCA